MLSSYNNMQILLDIKSRGVSITEAFKICMLSSYNNMQILLDRKLRDVSIIEAFKICMLNSYNNMQILLDRNQEMLVLLRHSRFVCYVLITICKYC